MAEEPNGVPSGWPTTADAARQATDPLLVMRRIVDEALTLIPAADGAVVELCSDDVLTYVCAAGALAGFVGVQVPLNRSLSGLAVRKRTTLRSDDTTTDPRADQATTAALGVLSMLCVPLLRGADVVGVLKLSSTRRAAFADADMRMLADLAGFIAAAVGGWADMASSASRLLPAEGVPTEEAARQSHAGTQDRVSRFLANVMGPGAAPDSAARRRIETVLLHRAITMTYQPIVDLKSGLVAGCEALARFPGNPSRPPDVWFAEAQAVGLGAELQLLAVDRALQQLSQLPADSYLSVNVGHDVAIRPELRALLEQFDCRRLVIEITEHLQVDDYAGLTAAVSAFRALGARLAIDDTGAGFAGFSHILRLAPELIKLDRVLTTGVDSDPARQALAAALVSFAGATRSQVIAEGIETAGELAVVRRLGIHFGQGYFLARPGRPADVLSAAESRRGSIVGR